jgi:hypothetical protein
VLPGAAVLALLRYAIDLLVPFSLLLLIPHSVRDTLADWLAGERYDDEPDPVWSVAVVSISLFGTAAGVLWLLSTSQWAVGTALQAWIPSRVVALTQAAEEHGWGRRVLISGGPQRLAPSVGPASPQADRAQTPSSSVAAPDLSSDPREIPETREIPEGPAATTGSAAEPGPSTTVPATPTMTTITTSATRVRASSDDLRVIAGVAATGRPVTGSVTFWDGTSMVGFAALDESGRAELSMSGLPPGNHLLTARYSGHGDYAASRSLPILIVVSP